MRDTATHLLNALEKGEDTAPFFLRLGFAEPARAHAELAALQAAPGFAALAPSALEALLRGPDLLGTARGLLRFCEAGGRLDADALTYLVPLCANSQQFARFFARWPDELGRLAQCPFLTQARPLASMCEELAAQAGDDPTRAMPLLRRFRAREHARIAWRDVTGAAPMEVLLGELADVAEALIDVATTLALRQAAAEHGAPVAADGSPVGFSVLGFGKLGGRELNFSSDVDLLYLYATDDGHAGAGSLHEHFARVARQVTRLIAEPTEDGFAFRVDLDLRPEGKKGPLVNSLYSLESYYETWGQTWERAALLKARPVGGDRALGDRALGELQPFVHRRAIDQGIVDEIRQMKARIDADEQRRGGEWNVKLGRGGIREIEFFVQSHQLLLSGKRPRLRLRGTLEALRALAEDVVVSQNEADALREAYLFLRRLEHRLQMDEGRQLHRLPEPPEERQLLGRRLGYGNAHAHARGDERRAAAALERDILRHRRVVMAAFDGLFHGPSTTPAEGLPAALDTLHDAPLGATPDEEAKEVLRGYGFRAVDAAYAHLAQLARTPGTPLHPAAPARTRAFAPELLRALRSSPDPDLALRYAADFLTRMRGRLGTFALLRENPRTLRTLLDLFGTSEFLAKLVVRRPELLDPLVIGVVSPRRSAIDLGLELGERSVGVDDERRLDVWREVHAEELLRIGLCDVAGTLTLEDVQAELTALAEALLSETLCWAVGAVERRQAGGEGPEPSSGAAPLCVIGMGKLGGGELNYNSDLDLLFLFEGDGAERTEFGGRSRQEHYAKIGQRLLFGLTCATGAGYLYHIDARLRPSGRHGSLVSSLASFRTYHEQNAHFWERLALTRARPVAGPPQLLAEAADLLHATTYGRPLPPGGAKEIARLRQRMELENGQENAQRYNVKLGRGGLVDVEFATQLLQLSVGCDAPAVRVPSTLGALSALSAVGAWDAGELQLLRDSYLFLRRLENRLRIVHDNAQSVLLRAPAALETLARRMDFRQGGAALLSAYEETTERVREVYRRIVEALP